MQYNINNKSTMYDEIKNDLKIFQKNRDNISSNVCRVLLGEIQRDPNKDYSDENITKIIRSIKKIQLKQKPPDYALISLIESYLPEPVSSPEILVWLHDKGYNKDKIMEMKSPMQVIGMLVKDFSDREVDTNNVKDIINNLLGV